MLEKIQFIFAPIILLVKTLMIPFLIAGVLYYLFRPIFKFLIRKGMKKTPAILTIYGSFVSLLVIGITLVGPTVTRQFKRFIENVPVFAKKIESFFVDALNSEMVSNLHIKDKINIENIASGLIGKVDEFLLYIGNNIVGILSTVTGAAVLVVVIPFVLFYLLKDGEKIPELVTRSFHIKHKIEIRRILSEMNYALSSYIQGQLLVSFIVGCMVYVGYLVIGLDYSLLLAVIAMITNLIPFVGPFIGLGFALIVGLMTSVKMAVMVVIIVLVVQQIESNFISPQIMGKKLDIHPLTIILLLLFAGRFAGMIGLLVAVPTYAVGKVIVTNAYRIWHLRNLNKFTQKEHPYAE